jgi:hypothetical protein
LTGLTVANKYILLSTNMFNEFKEIEHVAFIIAMRLYDYKNKDVMSRYNKILLNFMNSCMEADRDIYRYYFKEDFELALKDIKAGVNPFNAFLINPLFRFNFEAQFSVFLKALEDEILNENIDRISNSLNMLKEAGFDIRALNTFPFDKISFEMLIMVSYFITFRANETILRLDYRSISKN